MPEEILEISGDSQQCGKCGMTLSVEQFNWKDKARERRHTRCRGCTSAFSRSHYEQNKAVYKRRAKEHNRKQADFLRQKVLEYVAAHPCVDCGETNPVLLDFDHRERAEKSFTIGKVLTDGYSWDTIRAEIEKCDVRCVRCHRLRTALQFGWYRLEEKRQGSSAG
jgi:hypothetical protein